MGSHGVPEATVTRPLGPGGPDDRAEAADDIGRAGVPGSMTARGRLLAERRAGRVMDQRAAQTDDNPYAAEVK
jgi:hypothetical protein